MKVKDLLEKAIQAAKSARVLLDRDDANGACNRAYYAIFDAARAALVHAEHEIGKTHKGVLNAFNLYFVKNGLVSIETGRLLKHAETFRYVADYSDEAVEISDAQTLVEQAEIFVHSIQVMLDMPRT